MTQFVEVARKVLSENDKLAAAIRQRLQEHGLRALNLVSSPGSGKTTLLEKTLAGLKGEMRFGLIAGDVQTENDANRLQRAGGTVVRPVVTGGLCHLDARLVSAVLQDVALNELDLLFIENVGNLVCPASYDLGEDMKVVLISTTEGDDKPLKYPAMFRRSSVLVINKMDLLGTSDFDANRAIQNARSINAALRIFQVSCRTGQGLDAWLDWILSLKKNPAGLIPTLA